MDSYRLLVLMMSCEVLKQTYNELFEGVSMCRLKNGIIVVTDTLDDHKLVIFFLMLQQLRDVFHGLRQLIDELQILSGLLLFRECDKLKFFLFLSLLRSLLKLLVLIPSLSPG